MIEFFADLFHPLVVFVQFFLETFYSFTSSLGFHSYGFAIILLTVFIKALMYPLTKKQVESMKGMQELQPKLKKIQEQYKGNPQMLQQQMAEVYKEAGVNPLAGCLPLFIQMPILMGMFYALQGYTYPSEESQVFFWIHSLSAPDPLYVLPILSALTTWYQQKQTTSDDQNTQMKMMMIFMPIFIGWISLNFAAGLVLYWVTMNIVQIVQQWWMYREKSESAKEA